MNHPTFQGEFKFFIKSHNQAFMNSLAASSLECTASILIYLQLPGPLYHCVSSAFQHVVLWHAIQNGGLQEMFSTDSYRSHQMLPASTLHSYFWPITYFAMSRLSVLWIVFSLRTRLRVKLDFQFSITLPPCPGSLVNAIWISEYIERYYQKRFLEWSSPSRDYLV